MPGGHEDGLDEASAYHLARGTWPPAGAYLARVEIEPTAVAGAATRRALEEHLMERVSTSELAVLELLASELVNNAVVHGGLEPSGSVKLLIGAAPDCLRVEVHDGGASFERPRSPTPRGESGGFGLLILDRIAARWGVAGDAGSCVWFELDR